MIDRTESFRVLFLGQEGFCETKLADVARISTGYDFGEKMIANYDEQRRKNEILLQSIYKQKHLSVFEFAGATFQIECPIYVARQLMRYRNASYLERSLRRCKPLEENARYEEELEKGERKEDARAFLPLSTQTRFLWRMNLREMLHVFDERLTKTTQPITRAIVAVVFDEMKKYYPVVLKCWESDHEN